MNKKYVNLKWNKLELKLIEFNWNFIYLIQASSYQVKNNN